MKYALGILLSFLILHSAAIAQSPVTIAPEQTDLEENKRCSSGSPYSYASDPWQTSIETWGARLGEGGSCTGMQYFSTSFRFDLSQMPTAINIVSVKLKMHFKLFTTCGGGPYPMTVQVHD